MKLKHCTQVFLRRFRDPIRVPRIENQVPRIRENYHRVPRIRENRVPTSPYRVPIIFPKKNPGCKHNGLSTYQNQVGYCKTTFLASPCLSYILFNRPIEGKTALLRQKSQQTHY